MPGEVTAGFKLADTIASWLMSPSGYAAWQKRRALAEKHKEARRALDQNDFTAAREHIAALERLSQQP